MLLFVAVTAMGYTSEARAEARVPLGHVEVRGEGPVTMVLLSGATLDWRLWDSFMDRNKERYTMYALTLPGLAGSEAMPMPRLWRPKNTAERQTPPRGTPWIDNAVDAVVDLMHERGLEGAVVMGHDLGGVIALRLATEHEELVSTVISIEGSPAVPLHQGSIDKKHRAMYAYSTRCTNLHSMTDERWAETMGNWSRNNTLTEEDAEFIESIGASSDKETVIRYMVEQTATDITKQMDDLKQPTLAIYSSLSEARMRVINDKKRKLFGSAWHAEVRMPPYEEIGFLYPIKLPERFDAEIGEYLDTQGLTDEEPKKGH